MQLNIKFTSSSVWIGKFKSIWNIFTSCRSVLTRMDFRTAEYARLVHKTPSSSSSNSGKKLRNTQLIPVSQKNIIQDFTQSKSNNDFKKYKHYYVIMLLIKAINFNMSECFVNIFLFLVFV